MRTEQEKKEWHNKMRKLVKSVSEMTVDQRAAMADKMPIITCEGHALSHFNHVFLSMQCRETLTIVAGFKQWQKAKRRVQAGQHAAGYIYVPMIPKAKEGEPGPEPEEVRFRLVPVFDVAQTEEINATDAVLAVSR